MLTHHPSPCSGRLRRARSWLFLLTLGLLLGPAWASGNSAEAMRPMAEALRDAKSPSISDLPLFSGRLLAELYAARDYRNAWDEPRARAMLKLARASRADGFEPSDFHADAIERILAEDRLDAGSEPARTQADILLSDALLRYIHHFRFGKYNPRHINPGWIFVDKADADDLKADMELVLSAPDLGQELRSLLPAPDFYVNLKRGYARYLELADAGGWKPIPGGVNLTVGMRDPRIPLIRKRLAVTDGYEQPAGLLEPERYDEPLAEVIKGLQQRSGLAADAVIGPNTLRALNEPLDDRLETIRANLERMRWLYDDLPSDYVFVDLTAYRLHVIRGGREVWDTRVVIGTTENQTPMFRDEMEYLVFNPTWTVPDSIEKQFKGVPKGYKRVRQGGRYYLVQEPGPRNALGRVKFMFPNGHAIYLHDTPSRHLFARSIRAYSHGCVRVKDPLTLAQKILNKPNWDEHQINRVVARGSTRWVHLDEHLPVLLYYLTAVADDEGRVGFRRDIYHRDPRLIAALDRPADLDRIAFREPEPEPPAADPEPDMDVPEQASRTAATGQRSEAKPAAAAPPAATGARPPAGAPSAAAGPPAPTAVDARDAAGREQVSEPGSAAAESSPAAVPPDSANAPAVSDSVPDPVPDSGASDRPPLPGPATDIDTRGDQQRRAGRSEPPIRAGEALPLGLEAVERFVEREQAAAMR